MKAKKLICILLAVLTIISSSSVAAFAAESAVESGEDFYEYYTQTFASQKARVDAMTKMFENDSFSMYFDKKSGEFAIENKVTGEYVFSNPYDLNENSSVSVNLAKNALLSQVLIEYKDTLTGTPAYLSSFGSAATEEQLAFKTLRNGVRVEYALGTVEAKRLIPIMIEASRFENLILSVLEEAKSRMTEMEVTTYNKMATGVFYRKYDQTTASEIEIELMRESYSCLEKNHEMVIYVFQGTERSKSQIEKLIRKYCPQYTYDELEYDHELTEYESQEKELPLFRLAVEYTFDDKGMTATIPAKSIRYNSTNYALLTIVLLPYFGATSVKNTGNIARNGGYIFIPDGSGTLLNYYKDDGTVSVGTQSTGTIYGIDYSKVTLPEGTANAENAKIPVFGLTEEYEVTTSTSRINRPSKTEYESFSRGFVGIITAGETFANITANLGQMAWSNLATTTMEYNAVYASFSTTQADTVETGGTLGSGSSMSTTIDTKYTGNYSVKYIMLSDQSKSGKTDAATYEPTYVGMANAYRDYLIGSDQIDKLLASEIESGIPLYVESFGSIKATSSFLTFPITVTTPLTTFEDVKTMMDYFSENGISNQRFILTGFGNGTMTRRYYPTYVKWESKLGGNSGFKKLVSYAKDNGYIVFPEYDFMNIQGIKAGFSMRRYAAKTMSGRYGTYREYSYVFQKFMGNGMQNLISAGALEEIYAKFAKKYNKYNVGALSAKTMGYELNSDFNDKNPITREEAKEYIVEVLKSMREDNGSLLISGGNAYTFPYATDIIELPLDNSGYAISTYSVPFMGIVLHGYMNYAGKAVNMEGDTRYAILKSLENGAGLYFILSYRNTDLVKTSEISDYYSMMFETLQGEVIEYYKMLNSAIGDLQDATITAHSFPTAYRMSSEVAAVLFGVSSKAKTNYADATARYLSAVEAVDTLIKNQKNADAAIAEEVKATDAYNSSRTLVSLTEKIDTRYNTKDVVSVTYTAAGGKSKTFIINYNTYDVVVEGKNGKVFIVPAESFVDENKVTYLESIVTDYTAAEAYTPTTKQRETFDQSYTELKKAIADGNETMKERRIATVKAAIARMTAADNVVLAKTVSGKTVIINYTSSSVIVRISDTDYRTIPSQTYIVIED